VPNPPGGSVALAGENGAGTTVVMEEIGAASPTSVTLLVLFPPPSELWPPIDGHREASLEREGKNLWRLRTPFYGAAARLRFHAAKTQSGPPARSHVTQSNIANPRTLRH
jgi:hypothetical protein